MVRVFRDSNLAEFFTQFGRAGFHALVAWVVTAPLLFLAAALIARPLVNRLPQWGATDQQKGAS
jgi:hypothetical protein